MKNFLRRISEGLRSATPSPNESATMAATLTPQTYVEWALVQHRAGRTAEAETLYRRALAVDAANFDALHMLGVIQQQAGNSSKAVELIEQAIAIVPGNCIAHSNLGLAYQSLKRLDRAESSLRKALALRPDWDGAHNSLGTVLHAAGRVDDAEECFRNAVRLNPMNTDALNNLGNICRERGQLADAEEKHRRALAIDPTAFVNWKSLGQVLRESGRLDDAMNCFQSALELDPTDADVLVGIGSIHAARAELPEAEGYFRRVLQTDENRFDALCNLADVLRRLDKLGEAESFARKASVIRPDDPDALNTLACILLRMSALDEAEACCRKALAIRSEDAPTQITLGNILNKRHRLDESEACFRAALRLRPNSGSARYNLSTLRMLKGDYKEGLDLYESRFDVLMQDFGVARAIRDLLNDDRRWRGEDLRGQRLLIWTEQGFGDTLMVLRYLPMLKERGAAEIIVLCERELARLVRCVSGMGDVECAQSVAAEAFDVHCPIMSLPFLFYPTQGGIPDHVPYIAVPEELRHAWKERFPSATKLKVGLAWAGSNSLRDDRRSIPLAAFEPVMKSPEVQFVSLQKGEGSEQVGAWRGRIDDWMDDCDDFLDTAALVGNLDLIISIDSAIVHLAGALGKPVWLLNRYGSDWRWGLESEHCRWYPTMRIFRQRSLAGWNRVMAQVAEELRGLRPMQRDQSSS